MFSSSSSSTRFSRADTLVFIVAKMVWWIVAVDMFGIEFQDGRGILIVEYECLYVPT